MHICTSCGIGDQVLSLHSIAMLWPSRTKKSNKECHESVEPMMQCYAYFGLLSTCIWAIADCVVAVMCEAVMMSSHYIRCQSWYQAQSTHAGCWTMELYIVCTHMSAKCYQDGSSAPHKFLVHDRACKWSCASNSAHTSHDSVLHNVDQPFKHVQLVLHALVNLRCCISRDC